MYQVRQVPAVVAGGFFVNAGKKDVKGFPDISYVQLLFSALLRNACTLHGLVRRILYQGALYFRYRILWPVSCLSPCYRCADVHPPLQQAHVFRHCGTFHLALYNSSSDN